MAIDKASVGFQAGRDVWWKEAVLSQPTACPVVWMDAEATLFKLYTSGSTGVIVCGSLMGRKVE